MHENLTAPKPKKKAKKEKPVDSNDTGETMTGSTTVTPSHESIEIEADTNVHGDDDWATPKTNEPVDED